MKHISPEELLHALQWRYATKSFDASKKIPDGIWDSLEKALVLTPSSYGLQPWQFLAVQDRDLRTKLQAASWGQKQISECSHFVVFTARPLLDEANVDRLINATADAHGIPAEKLAGYKKVIMHDLTAGMRSKIMTEWNARQCYIALGNLMTSAALLGVDACPMEGLDPIKYDEILGLNETPFRTIVACAVGYRNPADRGNGAKKVRYPQAEMVKHL